MTGDAVLNTAKQDGHVPAFAWPVRVYYEDTDLAGVVYYANYLKFLERARTEWLRGLGVEQPELVNEHQVVFVVRAINIDYLRPARFDDVLTATVQLENAQASTVNLKQSVVRGTEILVSAKVRLVCVNTLTFRPVRIPARLVEKLR